MTTPAHVPVSSAVDQPARPRRARRQTHIERLIAAADLADDPASGIVLTGLSWPEQRKLLLGE